MGRESKKLETRQRISDVATAMFVKRGFDAVTVEEIAAAADVSKMTVFNYFARKEDLLFDREEDLLLLPFRKALRDRRTGQTPIDALRALVDELREQNHQFVKIHPRSAGWWRVVAGSPALRSRLHELEDAAADGLALELSPKPDGVARLIAGMLVLIVRTAREEGIRVLEAGGSARKANATLLTLLEQGFAAVDALR